MDSLAIEISGIILEYAENKENMSLQKTTEKIIRLVIESVRRDCDKETA